MTTPADSTARYRPDIDGLRALAILGVVAYHVGIPHIPGGYAGVDVFFVVSGFLITRLLTGEHQRTGEISLSHFYERRARRLLPALSVVILATLVLGYALLPFPSAHYDLGHSAVFTLLFASNRFFRLYIGGYFQDGVELMPLAHTWSLGVEEQFYLFYPLALLLFFKFTPRSKWKQLSTVAVAVSAASFVLSAILVYTSPSRAFYWLPSRAWELGVGAWLALSLADDQSPQHSKGALIGAAGLAAIFASFALLTPDSHFPGAGAFAPVIGTAMIIAAVPLSPNSALAKILSSQMLVSLGKVSYSWYLWHWPVLVIARRLRLGDANLPADAGWALLALGLAVLTTRFIERPFRQRAEASPGRSRRFVLLAVGTTSALVLLSFGLMRVDSVWPKRVRRTEAIALPYPCLVGSWKDSLTFGSCNAAPPDFPAAIALWGDSHAGSWAPAAWLLGDSLRASVFLFTKSSCPPLLGVAPRRRHQTDMGCVRENDAVAKWLRSPAAARMRGVILAGWWPRYVQGGLDSMHYSAWTDARDAAPWSSPAAVRTGLERTLALTDSAQLRVLIMLPPPEFPYPVQDCIEMRSVAQCGMSRAEADAYRASSVALVREVASAHPNARVIDPISFFCDSLYCPAEVRGEFPVAGASHVSAAAARAFAPQMREDFRWLIGGSAVP